MGDQRLHRAEEVAARIAQALTRADVGSVQARGTSIWFNGPEWDYSWRGAFWRRWRRRVLHGITFLEEGNVEVLPLAKGWRIRTRLTFDDFYQVYLLALVVLLAGGVYFGDMPPRLAPFAFLWLCFPLALNAAVAWWTIPRFIANAAA